MKRRLTRRGFLGTAAASAVFPVIVPASAFGAAERIAVGCIGAGPRGMDIVRGFLGHEEARVVAVCEVDARRRDAAKAHIDGHYGAPDCATYNDFRELVARDDIDVVIVGSTDHWHVLHALEAARAGKHLYVEKPLGVSLREDQALREAVDSHGVAFQFGTQQRSAWEFRFACELVRNGRIGKLETITVAAPPSIEQPLDPPAPVPDWLDYELWLGPAQWVPYTENRIVNNYWWHNTNFAVGFVAGWGIHHVDIAQWGNGADATGPVEVEGTGVFPRDGACDCATSWDVWCTYANGVRMHFTDDIQNPHGILFEGSEGTVHVQRGSMRTQPESLMRTVFEPGEERLPESKNHVGNLLDAARTGKRTVCPIDVAVRSDTICHLSDIAMRLGRKLRWDPAAERFVGDDEANRLLTRAMRGPWRL